MGGRLKPMVRRLGRDERGVTALITGLAALVFLGFVGLAIDVASWESSLRHMQSVADQAAFAAGYAMGSLAPTDSCPGITSPVTVCVQAKGVTANDGFVDGQKGVAVGVYQPPVSGPYAGIHTDIQVTITQRQPLMFAGLFLKTPPTDSVSAVAIQSAAGSMCVMTLDKTDPGTVSVSGTSDQVLLGPQAQPTCDLYNNSSSATDTILSGGAMVDARNIFLSGGYSLANNSILCPPSNACDYPPSINGQLRINVQPTKDPYANVSVPAYSTSGCPNNFNVNGGQTVTTTPGQGVYVYCGGITVNGQGTLNLSPGTYIIDCGNLDVKGGGTIQGTGVTIILTCSTGNKYGSVDFEGGSTATLTAPGFGASSGIPGIAIYVDRNAPLLAANTFNGGANENINGAIYLPDQLVNYAGGSSIAVDAQGQPLTKCSQLIAWNINFTGNSYFAHHCTNAGILDPPLPPQLVQ